MSLQESLSNQPIVIDNGSGVIKAGLAGVERPECEIRSYVGYKKYDKVMDNGFSPTDDIWVGRDLETRRGLCHLEYPIQHGIINNWDAMERIWKHIYSDSQLGRDCKDHPVFLTQAAISPNSQSEKMAEIFFETLHVPALFIAPQPLLSLYAAGKGTGVVVDIGDGVSTYFPVYDGYAITPQIRRVDMGGREMTQYLQLLLRKSGHIFSTSSEFEIVREIKESCCECSLLDTSQTLRETPINYVLPDGNSIQIGEERWQAAEALFNPQLVGHEALGAPQLLHESIMGCDMDLRKELYSNVLLSGGATLTRSFGKRLLDELKSVAPSNTKIRITAPPERNRSAWNGGCVLALSSPFINMWITREEYEYEGMRCIHNKSLLYSYLFKQTCYSTFE